MSHPSCHWAFWKNTVFVSHVSQPNYTHTPSHVLLSGWNPYLIGELSITSIRLVTIRSSQAQKSLFKVHQSILCDKSAFFKTMFRCASWGKPFCNWRTIWRQSDYLAWPSHRSSLQIIFIRVLQQVSWSAQHYLKHYTDDWSCLGGVQIPHKCLKALHLSSSTLVDCTSWWMPTITPSS